MGLERNKNTPSTSVAWGGKRHVLGGRGARPGSVEPKGFFAGSAQQAAPSLRDDMQKASAGVSPLRNPSKSHSKKYQFPSNNFDPFPGIGTYQPLTRERAEKKRRRRRSTNQLRKTISLCTASLHACSRLLNAKLCASRSS
jgi:hypothetical protein